MAAKHFISISLRDPWTDEAEVALVGQSNTWAGSECIERIGVIWVLPGGI